MLEHEADPVAGGGESAGPRAGHEPGPATGEVRISALEAAVAAGLGAASTPRPPEARSTSSSAPAFELPDWTDPPTGQVPRVLLGEGEDEPLVGPRRPTWREHAEDWDDEVDLSFLADAATLDEREAPGDDPARPGASASTSISGAGDEDEHPWAELLPDPPASRREARPRHLASSRRARARPEAPARRSAAAATATGLVVGAVALVCVLAGPLPTAVLAALVVTVAAGEVFATLRRAGYAPATLIGLLAVPAVVLGAYASGVVAIALVLALAVVLGGAWFLLGGHDRPLVNLAVTVFVVCWVGVLGSFAGLLLAPSSFPHRHGLAYFVAAVVLTVSHDVGSYAVGAKLGRHRFAAAISPRKSLEGLAGGTVLTLAVAALALSRLHPLSLRSALVFGALTCVVAPLGDLTESLVKRDLKVKDMGRLLPAHGGVLDRVDALLFVMPAAYFAVRLLNLG